MREDLLGYLLGALEPDEARRIERLLETDADLREELRQIEASLYPLQQEEEEFEPPEGLVSRTLDFIDNHKPQPAEISSTASGLSQISHRSAPRSWRVPDVVVAAISMIAIGGIMFPAILEGRFEARRSSCQNNLRQLGTALTGCAMSDPGERLPEISLEGSEAFAGIYPVELKERELITSDDLVWCASRNQPVRVTPIPTRRELAKASVENLAELQQRAGGHMAFTLGVMEEGKYRAPRMQSRSHFPILGDAPIVKASDVRGLPHDGRGVNLYYEDGSVRFVASRDNDFPFDDPYTNADNLREAGLNINDASLGESSRAPFGWVNQAQ